MSKEVETRVVSMEFDNSRFEANCKTTMGTLDKLKAALKFDKVADSFKGLENAGNNVKMGGLQNSVETITHSFSALEAIALGALMRIGGQAVDAGEKLIKSLSVDQISAGYDKYTEKLNAVKTIVSATGKSVEEVTSVVDKLQWYSDETSYSFTQMLDGVAKFTSAGVDLEKAVSSMTGIANAAADAGVTTEKAGSAFYNFAQAMGSGAMQMQDWKSIQNISMSTVKFKQTALDAAVAVGKLKKGADGMYKTLSGKEFDINGFETQLKSKWFDSEVMTEVLTNWSKYSDAVYEVADAYDTCSEAMDAVNAEGMEISANGFKAAQQATTLKEAIEATKDAVSSGWGKTFELIIGNLDEATQRWTALSNTLWDVFAAGGEKRNAILEKALGSPWEQLTEHIEEAGVDVEDVKASIIRMMNDMNDASDKPIYKLEKFDEYLKEGKISGDLLSKSLKFMTKNFQTSGLQTADATKKLEEFQKLAKEVIGGRYGNGQKRKDLLGEDYATVQSMVNKMLKGQKVTLDDLSDAQLKSIGYTDEQVQKLRELAEASGESGEEIQHLLDILNKPSGRDLLFQSIKNTWEAIWSIMQTIGKAWDKVFPSEGADRRLYSFLEGLEKFTRGLKLNEQELGGVETVFVGIFEVFKGIANAAEFVGKAIGKVASFFGFLTKKVFGFIGKGKETVQTMGAMLESTGALTNFGEGLANVFTKVKEAFGSFDDLFVRLKSLNGIQRLKDAFIKLKDAIGNLINNGLIRLGNRFKMVSIEGTGKFSDGIMALIDLVSGAFASFVDFVTDKGTAIMDFFGAIFGKKAGDDAEGVNDELDKMADTTERINRGVSGTTGRITQFLETYLGTPEEIKAKIALVGAAIQEGLSKINVGKMTGLTAVFLMVTMIYGIVSMLLQMKKLKLEPVEQVGHLLGNINGALITYQNSLKANILEKIGKGILQLAAAMFLLSFIKTEKLTQVAVDLALVIGVIAFAMYKIQSLKSPAKPLENIEQGISNFIAGIKSSLAGFFKQAGKAAMLFGLATAILAIVLSIVMLTNLFVDPTKTKGIIAAFVTIGVILALLAGAVVGMTFLEKKVGSISMSVGAMLAAMGFFISSIAASMVLLALIPTDKLAATGTYLAIAIMFMSIFAGILIGISAKFGDAINQAALSLIKLSAALMIFAIGIDLMIPALVLLGYLPIGKALKGIAMMSAVILSIMGIMWAIKKLDVDLKQLALLAGIAGVLVIVVAAMALINTFDMEALGGKLGAVVSALLALLGAIYVLQYAEAGAAALMFIGVGILAIAAALKLLENIKFEKVKEGMGAMFLAFFIGAAGAGILAAVLTLVAPALAGVGAALTASAIGIGIFMGVMVALIAFAPQLAQFLPIVADNLRSNLPVVINALIDIAAQIANALLILLIGIINGLADAVRNNAEPLMDAVGSLLESILELVIRALETLLTTVLSIFSSIPLVDKLIGWIEGGTDSLINSMRSSMGVAGEESGDAMASGLDESKSEVTRSATEMVDEAAETVEAEATEKMGEAGEESAKSYMDGFKDVLSGNFDINSMDFSNLQLPIEGMQLEGGAGNMLGQFSSLLSSEEGIASMTGTGNTMMSTVLKGATETIETDGPAVGEATDRAISEGMEDNVDIVVDTAQEVDDAAVKKFDEAAKETKKSGSNWIQGLINGIDDKVGPLYEKISNIASTMTATLNAGLEINSPSRASYRTGKFFDLGLINAVSDYSGGVYKEVGTMGEGMLRAMNDAVGDGSGLFDDDPSPVISPVLDLSNVQAGASQIDGMLSANRSIGMAATVGMDYNREPASAQTDRLINAVGAQIVNAINRNAERNDTNVNVTLGGDVNKIFKIVRTENTRIATATGYNPLAMG